MPRSLQFLLPVTVLAGALSCGGGGSDTPTTPTRVLTTVSVAVSPSTILVGQTATASATGADQTGAAIALGAIAWSSSNSTIASVAPSGAVTALAAGTVQIIATTGGKVGQASLTVTAPAVASMRVTPATGTIFLGSTTQLSATPLDANGNPLTGRTIAWSSSDATKANVSQTGVVTGIAAGTVVITAESEGASGQSSITVLGTVASVVTVTVSPANATISAGATQQLSASTFDANGGVLTGRAVTWSSSDFTKATVTSSGLVLGVAPGTVTISATSEGRTGSAAITVTPQCAAANAIRLNLGDIRTITAAESGGLCLGGLTTASEYVLIPFNNSQVPSNTTQIQLDATNTIAVQTVPNLGVIDAGLLAAQRPDMPDGRRAELQFRAREVQDIGSLRSRQRVSRASAIPSNITIGSVIQLNSNLTGNTCTSARVNHPARLVALLPNTMVFVDTLAPPGGYTDAELVAFAQAFDTLAYGIDTLNFGAVTDLDGNGRVAVFFTPGVNSIPSAPGSFVGGLFSARDLFSTAPNTGCIGSNEGEMFYMPVPDPSSTINGNYTNKTLISRIAVSTLAHELQHLINAARRIYVNNAPSFEQVWLNEGLSHIAEELLYYRIAGNGPFQNLTLQQVAATQPLVDAFNANMAQNFGRLRSYLAAPFNNSPYSNVDGLETRGAIWQLLRYASDQKGGNERQTWLALVNSTTSGQINFTAVLGDLISRTRDWAVTQFVDDIGLNLPTRYTHQSWNFRSILPAVSNNQFPIATSQLIGGVSLPQQLIGGGAAYVRFRIALNTFATITASSTGQPVPVNVDFILVRTQ